MASFDFEMTDSYMYAALVLHKAGKKIDEQGLTSVVKAAGVDVDQVKVKALASALSEINIDEASRTPRRWRWRRHQRPRRLLAQRRLKRSQRRMRRRKKRP